MTSGWAECETEPPHRGNAAEDAFRATCAACPHQLLADVEPMSGCTFVRCAACTCPLKVVVHRYGSCPAGKVPPPEIP